MLLKTFTTFAETKYSIIECQLLVIVWDVKHLRPYLFDRFHSEPQNPDLIVFDKGTWQQFNQISLQTRGYEIRYKPNRNTDYLLNNTSVIPSSHNNNAPDDNKTEVENDEDRDHVNLEEIFRKFDTFTER